MKTTAIIFVLSLSLAGKAQGDASFFKRMKSLDTLNSLLADTADVPNDALTEKIKILRAEKCGVNIESVLRMQLMEDRLSAKQPDEYYTRLSDETLRGHTSKLIENCVLNVYRRLFTEKEIDALIVFFGTAAGQKFSNEYMFLILETFKDTEQLSKAAGAKMH